MPGTELNMERWRLHLLVFLFVNKSRALANVIYVHTEVTGHVPNSAPFVNVNELFGVSPISKHTL